MSEERAEIYVTVGGERTKLVLPGDGWEYHEAKLAKDVSEGMAPTEIEDGLMKMDPDAWMAVLQVSLRRAGKEVGQSELAKVDIYELMKALIDKAKEVLAERPPTSPNGSESTAPAESQPSDAAVAPPSA